MMNTFEIVFYAGMAMHVVEAAWHVAILVVLIVIARRLRRS